MQILFGAGGSLVLIATVNWFFLIPALVFLILMILIRHLLLPTARSLKRLEAASKSCAVFISDSKYFLKNTNVSYLLSIFAVESPDAQIIFYTNFCKWVSPAQKEGTQKYEIPYKMKYRVRTFCLELIQYILIESNFYQITSQLLFPFACLMLQLNVQLTPPPSFWIINDQKKCITLQINKYKFSTKGMD